MVPQRRQWMHADASTANAVVHPLIFCSRNMCINQRRQQSVTAANK